MTRLIHAHKLETLYLCYGVKCQSVIIWGHWDEKVIFTKTDAFLYHDHRTHTYIYIRLTPPMLGVKCQSGVNWDHWGQIAILTNML